MGRIAGTTFGVAFVCLLARHSAAADTPQALPPLPPPPAEARLAAEPSDAPPSAPPGEGAKRQVYVHVDASDPVDLEWDGGGTGYNPVCTSPCDQLVPAKGRYRIAGTNLRPSTSFELVGDRATFRVAAASQSDYAAGKAFTVIGAVSAGIGGSLLLLAALLSQVPGDSADSDPSSSSGGSSPVLVLGVALGVGIALMAVGIPMMIINEHSRVSRATLRTGGAVKMPARWSATRQDAPPEQRAMPEAKALPFLKFAF